MGVWEDIILNAKVAVSNVGKKAGDIVDISKLKLSAAEINHEVAHQMEEVGRLAYQAKKDSSDKQEEIDKVFNTIDELYEQLSIVEDKIKELKKADVCPNCGANIIKDSVFCNKCGVRISQDK